MSICCEAGADCGVSRVVEFSSVQFEAVLSSSEGNGAFASCTQTVGPSKQLFLGRLYVSIQGSCLVARGDGELLTLNGCHGEVSGTGTIASMRLPNSKAEKGRTPRVADQ